MNKISITLSSISIIAVIFLFSTRNTQVENDDVKVKEVISSEETSEVNSELNIAYVDIDSVLLNYKLSVDLNKSIEKQYAASKAKLQIKANDFQKNYAEFTEKAQRNGFISQQSAEMQQQQLAKEQQELQVLEQNLTTDISRKQQEMTIQLSDSITNFLKEYNKDNNYQFIMSKAFGGILLYADEQKNITDTVLSTLNLRYQEALSKNNK